MAYQKELWWTPEGIRNEVAELLRDADFLDEVDEYDDESKRIRLQFDIIPRIFDELVRKPENDMNLQRLEHVSHLITYDEIGVAISDKKIDGRVGLFPLRIDNSLASLVILANEDVLTGLQSGDDRGDLVNKFMEVFLQAADEYRRFKDEERFVPYSKV